jgi:hypothetical protein
MSALIVPVDVMAYCVGTLDAQGPARSFVGATTDFTNQTTANRPAFLGVNVTRDASQAPRWPLEAGVHLHWAMPDALTRAPGGSGPLTFPPLPNRWLISRVTPEGLSARHWIVESDTLSTSAPGALTQPTVPISDPVQQPAATQRGFRYLGAWNVFDGSWSEPTIANGNSLKALSGYELHAASSGDIAFAAFYPNARGVFGFWDDLTDLTEAPVELMYVVTGWYGTPANDPLQTGLVLEQLQTQLGWTFASTAPQPLTTSYYSGIVQGLQWNPATRYIDEDPTPIAGDVALGNHPAEALAAYFRGKNHPALPAFEELLTLYATGLLPGLATPAAGQLATLEETLHELQFTGADGGTIYTLAHGTDEAFDLPLALADALNLLNAQQQSVDVATVQMQQAKWQLFADWLRLFEVDPANQDAALSAFSARWALQPGIAQNLQQAQAALAAQKTAVQNMLSGDLTLTAVPAARYYAPTEPVLLLAGDVAAPALRYGGDGRYHPNGYLVCRLDTDVLQAVSIGTAAKLQATQFAELLPPEPNHLPSAVIGALIEEAALLNSALGAAASGMAEAALSADLDAWLENGKPQYYCQPVGVPPSAVAASAWRGANPWCSLMVLWNASFHPLLDTDGNNGPADYPASFFTANYRLDPNNPRAIAYTPTVGGISIDPATIDFNPLDPQSSTQTYQGTAVLSPASANNLRDQLAKYLATTPDATLQAIADQLATTDVAMQSLCGFNDALLTQQRSLQLAIGVSPTAPLPFRTATSKLQSVVTSLADIPTLAPQPHGAYNALRAGYMKLSLQVMDPFGRKRPVQVQNTYLADNLTAESGGTVVPGVVYMQPRLAQPARLLWQWLAADSTEYDEMNSHPATTPVCGWVLPSHLGVSFFLYNAQGNPLGSLALRDDGSGVMWQSAPGNMATVNADLATVMQYENPHLCDLVLALGGSTPSRFRAFWQAADAACAQISPAAPDSQSGLGLLVGRPLAVVQASLRLERQGFAALDQTYATLRNGSFIDSDHALGGVQFPVIIGDLQRLNDGLVGYFKPAETGSGFNTSVFFSEAATGTDPGVAQPSTTNLLLTPMAASPASPSTPLPETKLLMLVDPRAPIHATMGILPTQALTIPAHQYQDILAGLEFTFPAMPLLRPAGGLTLPFPKIAGYNQSWITEESDASGSSWAVDPEVQSPAVGAMWRFSPQTLTEGWLRLNPELLRFSLTSDGEPVVTAGSIASLTLTLTNTQPVPITFEPGKTVGESLSDTGSVFYAHFGSLVPGAQVATIKPSAAGWQFLALDDKRYGNYWCATPDSAVTLGPGTSLTITLDNVAISACAPAQARVYFYYDNLVGCGDGIYEVLLAVLPAPP